MLLSPLNITPLGRGRGGVVFNLPTALHEWNYQNARKVGTTTTSYDTGTVGGLDMANPDVASQPTLTSDYLGFDGITQNTLKSTTSFRNSDTSGCFHTKFYAIDGQSQNLFAMAENSVTNTHIFIQKRNTNTFRIVTTVAGAFPGIILETNANTVLTGLNTCSIYHTGTRGFIILNGTKINVGSYLTDFLSQYWVKRFFDQSGTIDNVSQGVINSSTPVYTNVNTKYVCYEPYTTEANMLANHNLIRNTDF